MRPMFRTALTATATAALLVSGGTAATAQSATIKDRTSDVLHYADADDERGTQLGYADSVATGIDLRSMRIKHTKKSVVVDLRFSDLDAETGVYVALRLDGESRPSRYLINIENQKGQVVNTQGRKRCSVPLTSRTGKRGTIHAVIKRSCLGDPTKIKASVFSFDSGFFSDNDPYAADPLSPTAVRGQAWTTWLKAS